MNIQFWKMHGAMNDFILIDDREETFPVSDIRWIASVGSRRTGVGCEGIILIQPSKKADFRMRFFNPDGTEVEMCGNGARCIAKLAHELGAAPERMTIDTIAGILSAEVQSDNILLEMTPPINWITGTEITLDDETVICSSVNTGVPHVVAIIDDLDSCDVASLGAQIRYNDTFAPEGTNANFISASGPNNLNVRTYERGVEAETLACGTGIVASALIAARLGLVEAPVEVTAASGDTLIVNFTLTEDSAENVTLLGPAEHVFKGELNYNA